MFELEVAEEGADVGVVDDVGLECDKTLDEVRTGDVLTNIGVREEER